MNKPLVMQDALQANLGFLRSQTAHIEASVYRHRYPDLDFESLVPVDTSANPWVKTVTFVSMDGAGKARFINGNGMDIPTVGTAMEQFESSVHSAGIGYDYGLEELEQARLLGINLSNEKALVANRVYREFVYDAALSGKTEKSMSGLFNYPGITAVAAPADGTGASSQWKDKTPQQVLRDFNNMLLGVHQDTNTVAMADTVLLPWDVWLDLASRQLSSDSSMTILAFLRQENIYTARTGQQLTIRGMRGLDTAGAGSTRRAVVYRRAPDVLKIHIPMPHRFFPVQVVGLHFFIPGMFRLGGLDVRLPKEVRYYDGI